MPNEAWLFIWCHLHEAKFFLCLHFVEKQREWMRRIIPGELAASLQLCASPGLTALSTEEWWHTESLSSGNVWFFFFPDVPFSKTGRFLISPWEGVSVPDSQTKQKQWALQAIVSSLSLPGGWILCVWKSARQHGENPQGSKVCPGGNAGDLSPPASCSSWGWAARDPPCLLQLSETGQELLCPGLPFCHLLSRSFSVEWQKPASGRKQWVSQAEWTLQWLLTAPWPRGFLRRWSPASCDQAPSEHYQ